MNLCLFRNFNFYQHLWWNIIKSVAPRSPHAEGTVRECNTAGAATEKPPALELVTEDPSSTPSTTSSTSPTEPVEQFTDSSSIKFNCTQDREIPDNQQIRHANCDTKALCTPDGRFKVSIFITFHPFGAIAEV